MSWTHDYDALISEYVTHKDRAHRIDAAIYQRQRKLAVEAGISPDYLGVIPHNALVAYKAGKPWPGVDYSKVRLIQRLGQTRLEAHRLAGRWFDRKIAALRLKYDGR